jgi:hypothetical protein
MQRITLVRYAAKPEKADENEALSRKVFAELKATRPSGASYALFRDGNEFVHLFVNFETDDSSPVTELASFKAFTSGINERCESPPQTTRLALNLVESYNFSGSSQSAG